MFFLVLSCFFIDTHPEYFWKIADLSLCRCVGAKDERNCAKESSQDHEHELTRGENNVFICALGAGLMSHYNPQIT